jgi:peroxiredoxin
MKSIALLFLFTIKGHFKNCPVEGKYIYLVYQTAAGYRIDSARVSADGYELSDSIAASGPGTLFDVNPRSAASRESKHQVPVFLEQASFSILHTDSFPAASFSGSVANTDYNRLKNQMKPLIDRGRVLSDQYGKAMSAKDTVAAARLEQQLEALDHSLKDEVLMRFVKDDPASPVALFALENAVPPHMDADSIEPVFSRLSEANRTSADGIAFRKRMETARLTSIGHPAPDFTQEDTLGRAVSLSAFRGGFVLIDFWASWCGPCRMENPNVVAAYNRFRGKGFRIIGVSLDKNGDKDKWLAAIHKDGLFWTQLSDLKFWDNAVARAYDVNSIPQNFLLGPDGRIIAKGLRGEALIRKLEELYK